MEYVATLREGILEAFTGIVSAFKDTDKGKLVIPSALALVVSLLVLSTVSYLGPYAQIILDVAQRAMNDQERTESTPKLVFGLIGDLASAFPNGEIKQSLLVEWISTELRTKRFVGPTKQTQRWAREVSASATYP